MSQTENAKKGRTGPSVQGVNIVANSPLGREIATFTQSFTRDQFMRIEREVKGGKATAKLPAGLLAKGVGAERQLMSAMGWYWEPLLHDLNFLEQMRDSIALLSGAYNKFTDLVMDGFAFQHPDPATQKLLQDILFDDQSVDFAEVVRSCVFELSSIANAYRKPVYINNDRRGFRIKTFRPIRATAMRKLRDEDLVTEGYVQLLHRPSEFLWGNTAPKTPDLYLADEVACGSAFTHDWYGYGVPPTASLPFIVKQKLQMEKDLIELLHQHVPRIDVTYTPEEQMNQDQVDENVAKVKTMVSSLGPTDQLVHTPDTEIEYKGPLGKALDFNAPHDNIEEQLFYVLPLGPGLLGRDVTINPIYSQQVWRLTCVLVTYIRKRVEMMFKPAIQRLCDEHAIKELPTWAWTALDAETDEIKARTEEYQVQNAAAKRDAGFVDQDQAAKDATRQHPNGPVKKAAKPGAIPPPAPPLDPNKPKPGAKVGDGKKGPKDGRSAPTPDKRAKGKRHEAVDEMVEALGDIFEFASIRLGLATEDAPEDEA